MSDASTILGNSFLSALKRDGTLPTASSVLQSIKKSVDQNDQRTISAISRQMYANMGVPRGAINLKAMLAVGEAWDPKYLGPATSAAWAEEAAAWLKDVYYPTYNVRGPLFDFKTDCYLDSVTVDRCGDYFYLLTASDRGFPQVQAVPNYLVRTPPGTPRTGPYPIELKVPRHLTNEPGTTADGPVMRTLTAVSVFNGVAYNSYGRAFAYAVYEEAADSVASTKFKWVHEQYMIHIFDPEWIDQGRGFPCFTHAVREFVSMLTSQQFEEITHMIMSSISVEEHNEDGTVSASDPTMAIGAGGGAAPKTLAENIQSATDGEIPEEVVVKIVGGIYRYFKSNTGAKIQTPAKTSPGPAWDAFQDRLVRIALVGANMPPSIVWKGDEENGTSNRVSIEKMQRTVLDRQSLISCGALRKTQYGLAVAMNTNRLPRNDNWWQWGFSLPPEFIIDDGRIAKSDREDYVMGHQNLTGILARRGQALVPHLNERAEEEAQKQMAAKRVSEKYKAEGVIVTPDMLGTVKVASAPSTPPDGQTDGETPPGRRKTPPRGGSGNTD